MKKEASMLLSLVLVSGCVTTPLSQPATGAKADQTFVVVGHCDFHEREPAREAGGVAAAVISSVISNVLGRFGAALRAAGEEHKHTLVVRESYEFDPGRPPKCLMIARGTWGGARDAAWKDSDQKPLEHEERLLGKEPEFVLRLDVEISKDRSALKLRPTLLHYGATLKKSDLHKTRGLTVTVSFHPPGRAPDSKEAVGAALVIGDFTSGHTYNLITGDKDGTAAGWYPLEPVSAWFPTFAPAGLASTREQTGPGGSAPAAGLPRTVTLTVIETRAARPVLLLLADVFDASQEAIQKELERRLIASEAAKAELASATESTKLMTTLVSNYADAELALLTYCNTDADNQAEILKNSKAASVAQLNANLVAQAADQPQPYATIVRVGVAPSASGVCPAGGG